jgi:hypothetical protein
MHLSSQWEQKATGPSQHWQKKWDPITKITRAKGTGGMTHAAVQHLPSKVNP